MKITVAGLGLLFLGASSAAPIGSVSGKGSKARHLLEGEDSKHISLMDHFRCPGFSARARYCTNYTDLSVLPAYAEVPADLCIFDMEKDKYVPNPAALNKGCDVPDVDRVELAKAHAEDARSRAEARFSEMQVKRDERKAGKIEAVQDHLEEIDSAVDGLKAKRDERKAARQEFWASKKAGTDE